MVEMIITSSSRAVKSEQGGLFLPPGFRFHPTDEEVISSYLLKKLLNPSFTCLPIGEVDLNKCEPWDLPSKARMGEKEWYFFSHKDMKYPTGMRTNRATKEGYWKATGKDREIFTTTINNCPPPPAAAATGGGSREGREVVGMKKTLVFYMGRAPKGTKTNWVMHEFRLHGTHILDNHPTLHVNPKDEWVVCKVFHKKVDEATTNKKLHDAQQAAAAPETSAGTPNNGSSVVEAGDDLFHIDSIIDHPSVHLNNDSASSSLPVPANQDMAAPYNDAYYSVLLTNDNAASTTTTSTTAASFQLPNYSLINTSAAPPLHVSSWNNMPPQLPVAGRVHGIGGYNLQQQQQGHDDHQQAAMVRALGGVIGGPNFGVTSSSSRGLSRSATAAGANSQQNSLWVPQHKIESYNDPFIWEY